MVEFAATLSQQGPDLQVQKGVHLIFMSADDSPGPDPTPEERAEIAAAVGDVQKTDVIVFRGRPWHKIGTELFPHPQVHDIDPATVLDLRVGRDKAVWWSEVPFDIVDIQPDTAHGPAGPTPFDPPPTQDAMSADPTPVPIFVARSTVPRTDAKDHHYKISFRRRNGPLIDPNMRCT